MARVSRSRYEQVLVHIFDKHHVPGDTEVLFGRDEFEPACIDLGIAVPKNLGDVLYSFRYRNYLPADIVTKAPEDKVWILEGRGRARYAFRAVSDLSLTPSEHLRAIKVPDSTPGIVADHVLSSEQALLAKVRYNRLIDLFTGIVCYSLQNHLRASVAGIGQVETDEIYLGVDHVGVQYVIPVEAKGGSDRLSIVQMNQDLALAKEKFEHLEIRLVGVQFVGDDICFFLFAEDEDTGSVKVIKEQRYRLVAPNLISSDELTSYRSQRVHG
jgi:hypothetical protein